MALRAAGVQELPPPASIRDRVNATTLPAWPALARVATRSGEWLRRHGADGVVHAARRVGLQRIYRGSRTEEPRLSGQDRAWLIDLYASEVDYVEALMGRDLAHWRK